MDETIENRELLESQNDKRHRLIHVPAAPVRHMNHFALPSVTLTFPSPVGGHVGASMQTSRKARTWPSRGRPSYLFYSRSALFARAVFPRHQKRAARMKSSANNPVIASATRKRTTQLAPTDLPARLCPGSTMGWPGPAWPISPDAFVPSRVSRHRLPVGVR